jgi:hypothetical protein
MLLDSAVLSRRQNLRSSKSADRLTPAQPARELVESDFAEATPGSIPAPQKQLRPRTRGEVCLAQPSPPGTALKKGACKR